MKLLSTNLNLTNYVTIGELKRALGDHNFVTFESDLLKVIGDVGNVIDRLGIDYKDLGDNCIEISNNDWNYLKNEFLDDIKNRVGEQVNTYNNLYVFAKEWLLNNGLSPYNEFEEYINWVDLVIDLKDKDYWDIFKLEFDDKPIDQAFLRKKDIVESF